LCLFFLFVKLVHLLQINCHDDAFLLNSLSLIFGAGALASILNLGLLKPKIVDFLIYPLIQGILGQYLIACRLEFRPIFVLSSSVFYLNHHIQTHRNLFDLAQIFN